jgi:leukotriene-A4 hydrolase
MKKPNVAAGVILWMFLSACAPSPVEYPRDPHSFSRPAEVDIQHLALDLKADFEQKVLSGKASLNIRNKTGASQLHLDTRDLTIQRVTVGEQEETARFSVGQPVELLGAPLVVSIGADTRRVNIYYETSPGAAALQWLEPRQTAGGQSPFLFTQSQAVLARTWVPCQDTPSVRFTYEANLQVPAGLLALMSAENPTEKSADGSYRFQMPQAIPSYLLALAVGDIGFQSLGPRSGVYAEPSLLEKAAWEFADTEKMISAAEKLYGPYLWGRYDIIVLPPSFPFGGMENPRLTFATPTILAGDRSLVALVAHELAHSWSGNLVTNADWNDFWLNEGFTSYIEQRIMEELYGRDYAEMLAVLDMQSLRDTIQEMGSDSPDTSLRLDLKGRDPDEGMTDIAYQKGHFFLRMLEEHFGRERWDAFLRGYFDQFAFQSITSERFLQYLRANLATAEDEERLELDAWVYGRGLPSNVPEVRSAALQEVEIQLERWTKGARARELNTSGWTTHHWLYFLRHLPRPLETSRMEDLDRAFAFTGTGNSEILHEWLLLAIESRYEQADGALREFLTSQGRRKFLRPLYLKLAETPEGREKARTIYQSARPGYHSVSVSTIDAILNWQEGS